MSLCACIMWALLAIACVIWQIPSVGFECWDRDLYQTVLSQLKKTYLLHSDILYLIKTESNIVYYVANHVKSPLNYCLEIRDFSLNSQSPKTALNEISYIHPWCILSYSVSVSCLNITVFPWSTRGIIVNHTKEDCPDQYIIEMSLFQCQKLKATDFGRLTNRSERHFARTAWDCEFVPRSGQKTENMVYVSPSLGAQHKEGSTEHLRRVGMQNPGTVSIEHVKDPVVV